MKIIKSYTIAANYLIEGKIGIIPTDTIYGISSLTTLPENIEKIYSIKGRDFSKPFIILISDIADLCKFNVCPTKGEEKILKKYWPGPVSIILDVKDADLQYLHRGRYSLAFRLPKDPRIISILKLTGPLVTTSANISSADPIKDSTEAESIFRSKIDFMYDAGSIKNTKPSKIIQIKDEEEILIR